MKSQHKTNNKSITFKINKFWFVFLNYSQLHPKGIFIRKKIKEIVPKCALTLNIWIHNILKRVSWHLKTTMVLFPKGFIKHLYFWKYDLVSSIRKLRKPFFLLLSAMHKKEMPIVYFYILKTLDAIKKMSWYKWG